MSAATGLDLERAGASIVAVSDVAGGIFNGSGLNVSDLQAFMSAADGRHVQDWGGDCDRVDREELFELESDVLIPAALEGAVTAENAGGIQTRLIVEAANNPLTCEADEILDARGITVVPDILANVGGVIVSYCEWVQNIQRYRWSRRRVQDELESRLRDAWDTVESARVGGERYRRAAYRVAVQRVVDAITLRGF